MSKKGEPVLRWNGAVKEGTTEQAEWSSSAANDTGWMIWFGFFAY
jgi:hypothetical protein